MFVGVVVVVMLSIKIDKHRHIDNNDNDDRCYKSIYIHMVKMHVYTYVDVLVLK